MRICVSGTANTGKSTFVKDFIKKWPKFSTPDKTYRDILEEQRLKHSSFTSKETQMAILNFQLDQLQATSKEDNIIFDRGPFDCLVYSMWGTDKEDCEIDQEFVDKIIPLVRESMRFLDIIFFTPLTKAHVIPIEDDGFRDTDETFINEIDNVFKAINYRYRNDALEPFFPHNDAPAIIEIYGDRDTRIHIAGTYIDVDGDAIEGDMNNVLESDAIKEMETLLSQQTRESIGTVGRDGKTAGGLYLPK